MQILTLILILLALFVYPLQSLSEEKTEKSKPKTLEEAKDLRKILIVEIYATWCPLCKNIEPTLDELIKDDKDLNLIKFDVSTPDKVKESEKLAKSLKLKEYFDSTKNKTSTVAVFLNSTRELVKEFHNTNDIEEYKASIQEAKEKEKSLEEENKDE